MGIVKHRFLVAGILTGALLGAHHASAADAETEATLLKLGPVIVAAESDDEPWLGTACTVLLTVAGRAGDAPTAQDGVHVTPAIVRCAALSTAVLAGIGGPPSAAVASLLPGHRCMALAGGHPVFMWSEPKAGSRRLGPAPDPVITVDPPRVVNGYARVLRQDGQPGWVTQNSLREWTVAASPRLRCLPARMSDGSLGFTYAHPG